MQVYEQVQEAAASVVRSIAPALPRIGVILGSGLGSFADALEDAVAVPYGRIPGFAESSVVGHAGRLVAGLCAGTPVLAMQGRVHAYEGHPMTQVVLPVRTMIAAGCRILIITNASGGIREDLMPGDLVVISDHLNVAGPNPLVGPNDERLGDRFPDMTAAYDLELRAVAHQAANAERLPLKEGVYAYTGGPSYETPAEIRMLRAMGADLCGMSTVAEVIAANHMGARVLGISCVTNQAAGLGGKLSHEEVQETAARVRLPFVGLLSRIVAALRER
ncbi:MAG: purine-nucleoside phosphorylase [Deltaproteobacteria bacterium]|nr:purine-nucleoside phosphorylase [Deltaproteobacteria bacterium]